MALVILVFSRDFKRLCIGCSKPVFPQMDYLYIFPFCWSNLLERCTRFSFVLGIKLLFWWLLLLCFSSYHHLLFYLAFLYYFKFPTLFFGVLVMGIQLMWSSFFLLSNSCIYSCKFPSQYNMVAFYIWWKEFRYYSLSTFCCDFIVIYI